MICLRILALLMVSFSAHSGARAPAQQPTIRTLENVTSVVTASGPPIWEFRRGGKTLFVLGSVSYLPAKTTFDAAVLERRIAQSGVVVSAPGLVVGDNIGIFRGLTLWPGIRRNQFNADHKTLRDVLPVATWLAWQQASRAYGVASSVEKRRPMYAAYELFKAAARSAHLHASPPAEPLIARAARKRDIPIVDARFRLSIDDARMAVNRFSVSHADDVQCMQQTLDRLPLFIEGTPALADAWASGKMEQLASWAHDDKPMNFCWSRLTNLAVARQQGIGDLTRRVDGRWMAEVQRALETHDTAFSTLPLKELFDADGLGVMLQRAGFEMRKPD